MSEKTNNGNSLPTPEQIEDETLWLLDRQTEHAAAMDQLGITEKAKTKFSESELSKLNAMSRPTVALSRKNGEDGAVIEQIHIRFSTPGLSKSGHNTTNFVYAPLVEVEGSALTVESEFTFAEAEAVIDMAAGLKQAKDLGVLPHLSPDLTSIDNPLTAMMAMPLEGQPATE